MGYSVHKKVRKNDVVYRVWSSITDTYVTEELTEAKLLESMLFIEVERVIRDMRAWQGTSLIQNATKLERWESQMRHGKIVVPHWYEVNRALTEVAFDAIKKKLAELGEELIDKDS